MFLLSWKGTPKVVIGLTLVLSVLLSPSSAVPFGGKCLKCGGGEASVPECTDSPIKVDCGPEYKSCISGNEGGTWRGCSDVDHEGCKGDANDYRCYCKPSYCNVEDAIYPNGQSSSPSPSPSGASPLFTASSHLILGTFLMAYHLPQRKHLHH